MANPNDFPPLLPGNIPPSNSTSIPPKGGLCPDVVTQHILERPAAPLGEDLRASKKVRGFQTETADGVVAMEEVMSGALEKVATGIGLNVKAVTPEQASLKVSGPFDDAVFGPWMIADTRRWRSRKDVRSAVGAVSTHNDVQGSRFTVLEKGVADQGAQEEVPQSKGIGSSSSSGTVKKDNLGLPNSLGGLNGNTRSDQMRSKAADGLIIRDVTSEVGQVPLVSHVAVNNVTGTHSALVIHDGRQLKHSGGGALRVSVGKDPGVRVDEGQMPSSNLPIIIPDDRPFEPGDNRSNLITGCLEDDMEVIEEDVETLSQ
ncbi:hypothetical protein V6N12_049188 [Hibiscus sabdariffa]|uniref:Uncharacterized protein n=1 Tax=Hibiscus sabdariffa TaxID=183260 RepID=A0ABR2EJH9_9ROSI